MNYTALISQNTTLKLKKSGMILDKIFSFCFSTNSSRARAASALACLRASVDDLADKLDEF
jgi:hypothetical protein